MGVVLIEWVRLGEARGLTVLREGWGGGSAAALVADKAGPSLNISCVVNFKCTIMADDGDDDDGDDGKLGHFART